MAKWKSEWESQFSNGNRGDLIVDIFSNNNFNKIWIIFLGIATHLADRLVVEDASGVGGDDFCNRCGCVQFDDLFNWIFCAENQRQHTENANTEVLQYHEEIESLVPVRDPFNDDLSKRQEKNLIFWFGV